MRPSVAFVSREVYPLGGGGIGNYVAGQARLLSQEMDVAILTSDRHAATYRRLEAEGDPRLPPADVRVVFVPDSVDDHAGYYNGIHAWSDAAHRALIHAFPDGGPDLVEFPDYLAEGTVTLQARLTDDPAVKRTAVVMRAYTTAEICDVLDGWFRPHDEDRVMYAMERFCMRFADRYVWAGGGILATQHAFYGTDHVAPGAMVRHPLPLVDPRRADEAPAPPEHTDGRVRLLYIGRLERRKGVHNLVRAVTASRHDDVLVTLVGGDTPTGPMGTSMRAVLEEMADGDPRIEILGHVDHRRIDSLVQAADAVVLPSLWECWPNTGLEAMSADRPVIATPTGGYLEMVDPGVTGWLTAGTSWTDLADTLDTVLDDRQALVRIRESRAPSARQRMLTDPETVLEGYRALVRDTRRAARRPRRPGRPDPLVSVIVPYFQLDTTVEETIASLAGQTHRRIEVLIVDDGSFRPQDGVLAEVAVRWPVIVLAQENQGLGAARNFGISQARGDLVLPVDADDVLEPDFVERCVAALESDPAMAYCTTWTRYMDEDGVPLEPWPAAAYRPIGNALFGTVEHTNVAGSCSAVFRRSLFSRLGLRYREDLASFEDWMLFTELHDRGLVGHVIPEYLMRYRVRRTSMLRTEGAERAERIRQEMEAHRTFWRTSWTSSNA